MNVLFLLRNHFTVDSRVLKEARSLVRSGHNVTVRAVRDESLPLHEMLDGIHVERLTFSPSARKAFWAKILTYIRFGINAFRGAKAFDVVHCHDLDTLPIGALLKGTHKNLRLIYDAHEHETEVGFHVQGLIKIFYQITERLFIRCADAVITVSESIANDYVRLYSIEKPHLIMNCPPLSTPHKTGYFRDKFSLREDQIIFLYQGGLFQHRGIEKIIQAFQAMPDDSRVLVFLGYGPLGDDILKISQESERIFLHEAVAPDVLLRYTASADVVLCTIENQNLNYYYCLPNKLFEYIMAGLPVVISDFPEMRKVVDEFGCGIKVNEISAPAIQSAVSTLERQKINAMAQGTLPAREKYCWAYQEQRLLEIYAALDKGA